MTRRLSLLFFAAALVGCDQAKEVTAPEPVTVDQPARPVPAQLSDLTRADLLNAVGEAASAYASGQRNAAGRAKLDGRTFNLTVRFGCAGPAAEEAPLGWTSDEERSKIDIHARPTLAIDPATLGAAGAKVEAVEGFWLPRPWVLADACPAPTAALPIPLPPDVAAALRPAAPADQTVGIAQYYGADDSRTRRRGGRAYSATEKLDPPGDLPRDGIRLRIEGRLRAWPDGKVIRCTGAPNERPSCVLSATIDRVAFERPEDGAVIAQWAD